MGAYNLCLIVPPEYSECSGYREFPPEISFVVRCSAGRGSGQSTDQIEVLEAFQKKYRLLESNLVMVRISLVSSLDGLYF
jgi:hypothetical protein